MTEYTYRIAGEHDLRAITDIYNAAVIAGGSSADLSPRTLEQRKVWVESHQDPYAVFVVEAADDDGNPQTVGFGALSVFYDNAGSIALMRRFGFTQFGLMPAAATDSTGTMRDMSYWYLDL